jgi:DNA repair photolyase
MKPIYEPKGKAKEYGDYCVNIYTGCNHGCTYCYARMMHERWQKTPFDDVQPKAGLLDALYKQLDTGKYEGKLIHLCFTCDPYPADVDTTITRQVIAALKGADCHVQILTKGGYRAERDFDLLDPGDWFGVTISGAGSNEPGAASEYDRLRSLRVARRSCIKTWVSFEPVYSQERVFEGIKWGGYIDLFRIGKLNYHPSPINWGEFGRECERLAKQYGRNIQIKDELRKEMEATCAQ